MFIVLQFDTKCVQKSKRHVIVSKFPVLAVVVKNEHRIWKLCSLLGAFIDTILNAKIVHLAESNRQVVKLYGGSALKQGRKYGAVYCIIYPTRCNVIQFIISGTVCIGLALYWHCMYWYNLQCANSVCNGLTCIALYVLFSIVCQYCMYWADLQCANSVYI
jgi:hypothetical protein